MPPPVLGTGVPGSEVGRCSSHQRFDLRDPTFQLTVQPGPHQPTGREFDLEERTLPRGIPQALMDRAPIPPVSPSDLASLLETQALPISM